MNLTLPQPERHDRQVSEARSLIVPWSKPYSASALPLVRTRNSAQTITRFQVPGSQ
jgi:hypothetical protein